MVISESKLLHIATKHCKPTTQYTHDTFINIQSFPVQWFYYVKDCQQPEHGEMSVAPGPQLKLTEPWTEL